MTRPSDGQTVSSGPPPLWTLTFLTYLSINLCIFMGFDMLLPTLSLYLVSQGLPKEVIGLIFASFAVSSVTSRLLTSRLGQRFGPLTILRCGLMLCCLGSFMFFVLPHTFSYVLARLMFGAGYGFTSTLMISMAAQTIPPSRLGEGLGYLGLGATVALAAGPLLGLELAQFYGYRTLFVTVALCYVAGSLISLTLPKVSLASPDRSVSFRKTFSVLKNTFIPCILIFIYGMAVCAVTAYLAVYCEEKKLPGAAGFFVISTIGTLASRLTSGRIYDRCGHFAVIPPAILLITAAVIMIYTAPSAAAFYAASVIYGLGVGSLFPAIQALTLSSVPMAYRTGASALFFNSFDVGIGLGTLIMGFLAGWCPTFEVVYLAAGLFAALMLTVYFVNFSPAREKRPAA
ncbi:MAG: MFS transporter [Deltaproteobacteria bacterium]|nr:MFS transporter [Deltaproteobacteria bacterium]